MRDNRFRVVLLSTLMATALLLVIYTSLTSADFNPSDPSYYENYTLVVVAKETGYNIDGYARPPLMGWRNPEITPNFDNNAPLMMIQENIGAGNGRVVVNGFSATCRGGTGSPSRRWLSGEFEIFMDKVFRWLSKVESGDPTGTKVLWFEGHVVYDTTSLCKWLVDNLEMYGYDITGSGPSDDLDDINLSAYDIVVLPAFEEGPEHLSENEISDIVDYVENDGGGVLFMCTADYYVQYADVNPYIMAKMLAGLGFHWVHQDDQVNDPINNQYDVYAPIADVDNTTWIGSEYQRVAGKTSMGVYSVCSLGWAEDYDVSISIEPEWKAALPGANLNFEVVLMNRGMLADNFTLTVLNNVWTATFDDNKFDNLEVFGVRRPTLTVMVPPGASPGDYDEMTVVVASDNASDNCSITARAANKVRPPVDDARASENAPDSNFGGWYGLHVGNYVDTRIYSPGANGEEITYLKFDISGVEKTDYTSAKLSLYVYSVQENLWVNPRIQIYEVPDTNWTEEELTWNNKPGLGSVIAGSTTDFYQLDNNEDRFWNWDVTSWVDNRIDAVENYVSFAVVDNTYSRRNVDRDMKRNYHIAMSAKEVDQLGQHPALIFGEELEIYPEGRNDPHEGYSDPDPYAESIAPGENLSFDIWIANRGFNQDTYDISVSVENAQWTYQLSDNQVTLNPLEDDELKLTVSVPGGASVGDSTTVTVTASSTVTAGLKNFAKLTAKASENKRDVGVDILPEAISAGWPGKDVEYTVEVTNEGTITDSFVVGIRETAGWSWTLSPDNTVDNLAPDESENLILTVTTGNIGVVDNICPVASLWDNADVKDNEWVILRSWHALRAPIDDTFVQEAMPRTPMGSGLEEAPNPTGGDNLMWVGRYEDNRQRAFLKFDLTQGVPESYDSVRLYLYAENVIQSSTPNVQVHEVSNAWDDDLIWENMPSVGSVIAGAGPQSIDDNFHWYSWNVTNWVNSRITAGENEVSFALIDNSENVAGENRCVAFTTADGYRIAKLHTGGEIIFRSHRPFLAFGYWPEVWISHENDRAVAGGSTNDFAWVNVRNMGVATDNFTLTALGWSAGLSDDNLHLGPTDNGLLKLTVTAPGVSAGSSDNTEVTVTVTSSENSSMSNELKVSALTENLKAGWNLISFPAAFDGDTPDNIFAGVGYAMFYLDPQWGFLPPVSDEPVELGEGYWVKLDETAVLTTTYMPMETFSIDFRAGWNLIGFPVTSADTTPDKIFVGLDYAMFYLDPVWGFLPPVSDEPVEPGLGYWVKLSESTRVIVPLKR